LGRKYNKWDGKFYFTFNMDEGSIPADCLINDMSWLIVSKRLMKLLEEQNTEIQFFPVKIIEKMERLKIEEYYIANVIKMIDALCLERSVYTENKVNGYENGLIRGRDYMEKW
jgi:hypothetical protein